MYYVYQVKNGMRYLQGTYINESQAKAKARRLKAIVVINDRICYDFR